MLHLHRLLHVPEVDSPDGQKLIVIVEDQGRRLALRVDELLGQQQVVIKNLETNFRKVPGVAGATILGDGRVALILDVYGVSQLPCHDPIYRDVAAALAPHTVRLQTDGAATTETTESPLRS